MTRPEITISELADTMLSNLPVVTEANAAILNAEVAHQLQVKLSPLADILEPFNRKRSSGNGDTKAFLKFMIAESYKLGAAMFLKATQYMVTKALVSNPDKFVSKIKANGPLDTAFQSDPNATTLINYLNQGMTEKNNPVHANQAVKRSLLEELD